MESTAQYWRPVWAALERHWTPRARARAGAGPMAGTLHLAQAQSNRAPRGRKRDFADAERLVRRLVAQELILSFVPAPEQRLWRTVTRTKVQLTRNRVQLQNRLEALLEQAHLKLSSIRRALTPRRSETRLESLRWACSSRASSRFWSWTRLRVSWTFVRVPVRYRRLRGRGPEA